MKTQGSLSLSKLLILYAFFSLNFANAHPLIEAWQNQSKPSAGLFLEPKVSFFSTSTNYDSTSSTIALPNSVSVTQTYFDLNADYGLTPDFFIFARGSLLSVKVQNPGQKDLTAFGLADQLVGASLRVLKNDSGANLSLQFDATIPAYQKSSALTSGSAYLGDQSVDFTLGSFAQLPLTLESSGHWYGELGGGYTYRSKGYSAAVPVSLFLKREPIANGLLFGLGVRGQFSLKTDANGTTLFAQSVALQESNRGAGGSFLIEGINPAWLAAQGNLGYQNDSGKGLLLSAAIPFSGTYAPSGFQASLSALLSFGTQARANEGHSSKETKRKANQPHGFSSYDLDAKVTSVNDQLYVFKIDKGSSDTLEKGQLFDIFNQDTLTARARIISVKDDEAALNVIEYYQDHWIDIGFTARRIVQ